MKKLILAVTIAMFSFSSANAEDTINTGSKDNTNTYFSTKISSFIFSLTGIQETPVLLPFQTQFNPHIVIGKLTHIVALKIETKATKFIILGKNLFLFTYLKLTAEIVYWTIY